MESIFWDLQIGKMKLSWLGKPINIPLFITLFIPPPIPMVFIILPNKRDQGWPHSESYDIQTHIDYDIGCCSMSIWKESCFFLNHREFDWRANVYGKIYQDYCHFISLIPIYSITPFRSDACTMAKCESLIFDFSSIFSIPGSQTWIMFK